MFVSEAMNKKPKTISPDAPLERAVKIMKKHGISSLIVLEKRKPSGIITSFDVFSASKKKNASVKDAMKKNLIYVSPEDSLNYAASLMMRNKVQKLPVLENGKLVGIITVSDMMMYQKSIVDKFRKISDVRKYMGVGF